MDLLNTNWKTVSPQETRVGWVGTGVMGAPMCRHVLEKGYQVTVYNRTRAKAEALLDTGAQWAHSPKAVAEASDIVFTIVGYPADVREVYLGADGLLSEARAGAIFVDMTTSQPKLAAEIAAYARNKGAIAIDAPVSGGDVGARNGTLSIMIGGEKDAVDAVMPLFEAMGQNIVHQGGPGSGQHTKMCNQIVIAGTMVGVCESLLYGARAGLDLERMLASITKGAAGCWTLDNLAPRVLKRNFEPGFFVEHFIKDMGIALDEAKRLGLALPGLALVHELYVAAKAQGHGRLGTHALMLALEQMAGISTV
jgi:3-hydroxyisobutyrate dehydrogenase